MYSLFCEAKFWTLKNDIQIRNTDFGAFRYHDKKEIDDCPYLEGKKKYCDQRGTTFVLKNKRPFKLRDRLKELEQQLLNNKVVFFDWKHDNIIYLIFNTGLIAAIGVHIPSKDIYKVTFDRFLIGKLLSENICDVVSTSTHLIISYNENQLTIVNYNKPYTKYSLPQKLSKLEPKVQLVELCGPTGRRLDRRLSLNKSGDMMLTWWHSTRNEVYPWSPLVKDEDRANVHIYSLVGTKIELLCFYRTEFDLINVSFSQIKLNLVWLIEQKVSKKGDVTIEYSSHEIVTKFLKRHSVTSIPLQTQICCHSISPDEEKLVLGCIDGSLILFDETRRITRLVKTAFIPNLVSWHNDGALIIIANERSQFQFFDFALSCVRSQLLSEEVASSNLLDLATYFKAQPILLDIKWNKKANALCYSDKFIPNDGLLLLIYESGPLAVLSLIGGGGLANDVQNCGLTADAIIRQYLYWNQSDKALNVLLSLNWNTSGSACLAGLNHIANYTFRHPFTPESEIQLEAALGSFYAPSRPLSKSIENEFGNQVHDLTRRFFHHLLRHHLYEKAYCLAIDLSNADLFVDLYHCAKTLKDEEMAFACCAKIEEINGISENSSDYSQSSCSCTESSNSEDEDEEGAILPPLPQVSVKKSKASKVPPLPDLNRNNRLRGSAFFNCNSSFLPSEILHTIPEVVQTTSTSFNEFYPSILNHATKTLDYGYTTTQILTPEFPHSFETRTSFLGQESRVNAFTPVNSTVQNQTDSRNQKPASAFANRPNALNVIENLYDLPKDLNLASKNISHTSMNNLGPLRLKSPQSSRPNQFYAGNVALNSFPTSKFGSFDYLLSVPPPQRPRLTFSGGRIRMNYQIPRGFGSRPVPNVPSSPSHHNNFNNLMMQRPLHYVPNSYLRHPIKSMEPSLPKQKVKFSDTVTQIVVPDISKISIEDERQSVQHRIKNPNRTPKITPVSSSTNNFDFNSQQCHENLNCPREFSTHQDPQEEEENNGAIKVIHFGVV